MFVLTLDVEEYDYDFKFFFKGKAVEENNTIMTMGDTEYNAWKNLVDNLTYAYGFEEEHTANPKDGWAFWAKRIVDEFPKLISGELDIKTHDTYTHAYYQDDEEGWKIAKIGGNRVFEIKVQDISNLQYEYLNSEMKYQLLDAKDNRTKEFNQKFGDKTLKQLTPRELYEWYEMIN